MKKLDELKIRQFLQQHEYKKASEGIEEKRTMVFINGKPTYLDTSSVKETLKEMSVEVYSDEVKKEYNSISDFRHTNITVIKKDSYFIINGAIQTRNEIHDIGIMLYGKCYSLVELGSLTINKKYMDTDEVIRYFGNNDRITINNNYTLLEKALMGVVSNDSYKASYGERKNKQLHNQVYLYTLSVGIEDIMAIIDTLMENFIQIDYSELCFIRNNRYPININQLEDRSAILNKIKFPFLCTEWVCDNLEKYFIDASGYKSLYEANDLIDNSRNLTKNKYNDFTLEESLVQYLFNFDTMLKHEAGYSYIDIPTLYQDGDDNVSTTCRFVYLHGLIKSNGVNGRVKIKNLSKGNIYNTVLKDINMHSLVTSESELLNSITRLMSNDIVFNSIIEFYYKAQETFMDRMESFKDHVIEFDMDNPDLKINIRGHIFKYRYMEARKVLSLSTPKDDYEDTDEINNFILNEENVNKETSLGVSRVINRDFEMIKKKEDDMKNRGSSILPRKGRGDRI